MCCDECARRIAYICVYNNDDDDDISSCFIFRLNRFEFFFLLCEGCVNAMMGLLSIASQTRCGCCLMNLRALSLSLSHTHSYSVIIICEAKAHVYICVLRDLMCERLSRDCLMRRVDVDYNV